MSYAQHVEDNRRGAEGRRFSLPSNDSRSQHLRDRSVPLHRVVAEGDSEHDAHKVLAGMVRTPSLLSYCHATIFDVPGSIGVLFWCRLT